MLIDTHVHICDSRYDADRDEMLARSEKAGVAAHVNIGAEAEESLKVIDFDAPGIYKAIGLHPHYVGQFTDKFFEDFKTAYREKKNMAAVGEIGLDFFKSPTSHDVQEKYFRIFMEAAVEINLPVIIHSREAHDEVREILKEYDPKKRGIIHCFTGDYGMAKKFYDDGYLLGIGGVITFPNAGALRETVEKMPLESMVLETDAPWLAPQDMRGQRNEPSYLVYITDKLASIKGINAGKVEEITTANAKKIFNMSL